MGVPELLHYSHFNINIITSTIALQYRHISTSLHHYFKRRHGEASRTVASMSHAPIRSRHHHRFSLSLHPSLLPPPTLCLSLCRSLSLSLSLSLFTSRTGRQSADASSSCSRQRERAHARGGRSQSYVTHNKRASGSSKYLLLLHTEARAQGGKENLAYPKKKRKYLCDSVSLSLSLCLSTYLSLSRARTCTCGEI